MSWTDLPTDYQDAHYSGLRKYRKVENSDGTWSFQDVTEYQNRERSFFSADDANQMNQAINDIMNGDQFFPKEEGEAALETKAPINSPAFTGTPTAPTPDNANNSDRVATTAFVREAISRNAATPGHNHDDRYYTETETDNKLAAKAPLASPAFSGNPTAPTPATGNNSTRIATTGFVHNEIANTPPAAHNHDTRYYTEAEIDSKLAGVAPLASPAFTGNPTAPTPAAGNNSTKIATTAFVRSEIRNTPPAAHNHDNRYYTEAEVNSKLSEKAPISSPVFTGAPAAPNPSSNDSSTRIATTQFVQEVVQRGGASSHNHDDRYYTEGEIDNMMNAKAPLASPQFSGNPTAPTPAEDSDSNSIATTAFVKQALQDVSSESHNHDDRYYKKNEIDSQMAAKAPLASPAFSGNPTAPTPAAGNASTQIATTAFVQTALENISPDGHNHDDRYYTETETDNKLAEKAPLASPAFTGSPTAPTPAAGNNSTRLATTAFVKTAIENTAPAVHNHDDRYYTESEIDDKLVVKAPLASPAFTGEPTAPTLASTDSSTKIATTAYVKAAIRNTTPATHNHDDRYYNKGEQIYFLNQKAPLADPAFSGTPTAPTAEPGTDTTQIATTEFVQTAAEELKNYVDDKIETSHEYWVNKDTGDDEENDGSQESPFKTLQKAINTVTPGGAGIIHVEEPVGSSHSYGTISIEDRTLLLLLGGNIQTSSLNISQSFVRFARGTLQNSGSTIQINNSQVTFEGTNLEIVTSDQYGIYANNSLVSASPMRTYITGSGIVAGVRAEGSHLFFKELRVDTGDYAGISYEGSVIAYDQLTGNVEVFDTDTGGIVRTGKQEEHHDTYYYVDGVNGDDDNPGSLSAPLATIQKAIALIGDDEEATVNIMGGGYLGNYDISAKHISFLTIGDVVLMPDPEETGTTPYFRITNDSLVRFGGPDSYEFRMRFIVNDSALIFDTGDVSIAGGNGAAIDLSGSSLVFPSNSTAATLTSSYLGLSATRASRAYMGNVDITATTGIEALEGSIVAYRTLTGTMTTETRTDQGGRVFTGSEPADAPYDDHLYGRKDGGWYPISSAVQAAWGNITGTITDQTDLTDYIRGKINPLQFGVSYYIDPVNGSDTNDGSQSHPFATIMRALDTAGSAPAALYLASGTYNDSAHITGFDVRSAHVGFYLSDNVIIPAPLIITASRVVISSNNKNITLAGMSAYRSDVYINSTTVNGTTIILEDTHFTSNGNVLLNKANAEVLQIRKNSQVFVSGLNLTGQRGIAISTGSVLAYETLTENTTQADTVETGARIHSGVMDYLLDAPSDGKTYSRKNATWSEVYSKSEIDTALNGKQNTLTFDTTPTAGSTKPVTSGGIKTALDGKQNTLTFDTTPTYRSTNPVTSGGVESEFTQVYNALSGKQPTLTFDTEPTTNSTNPVTSGGIKTALNAKANASSVYTKTQTDTAISTAVAGKADASNVYTKTEVDGFLADKADADDVYTKTEIDDELTDIDTALNGKAEADTVYTKAETDEKLDQKAGAIEESSTHYLDDFAQIETVEDHVTVTIDPYQTTGTPSATNILPFFTVDNGKFIVGPASTSSTSGTYTVNYGIPTGTIYGCKIDPLKGKVYKTWERIASYDGETLPGEWKSDRDVYDPDETPTAGAEVVYKLAEPVEITVNIFGDDLPEISALVGLDLLGRAYYVKGTSTASDRVVPTTVSRVLDTKTYVDNTINFGYCETAGGTAAKTVDIPNFELKVGSLVVVKFQHANTADNPTLNVSGTGAKPMYQYGTTAIADSSTSTGWATGSVMLFVYDGTGWIRNYFYNTTYTVAAAYCSTSAGTAAKSASCSYYYSDKPQYFQLMLRYSNTNAGALTLNVNSSGAKPVYIDGQPSSAENYTLPRGPYIVYYDGENYYFDTTGKIPDVPKVYVSYGNETLWICHNKVKTVNVYNQNMSLMNGKSVSWTRGMDYQFILEVLPNDANPNVVWASSDESAMTIDQSGYCTALAKNAPSVISATAMDGSGVVASFTMTFK